MDYEKPKDRSTGVPMWYVTFADLSTLMLTFFVLLISFANTDMQKFREMLGSVKGAFGVEQDIKGVAQPYLTGEEVFEDSEKEETPVSAKELDALHDTEEKVDDMMKNSAIKEKTKVIRRNNEIVLRVDGGALFYPGSTKIRKEGIQLLVGLAKVLKQTDFLLTVEGHTDSIPISTEQFPSNWELSGVRATTVLRFLISQKISADRMRAIGYAATHPIADNKTPESRAQNRRVEFILKKPPTPEKKGGLSGL